MMTLRAGRPTRLLPYVIAATVVCAAAGVGQPPSASATRASLPPLHHESVAFDAANGRLVVYGGSDSLNGTWAWSGDAWFAVADSATSPPWRSGAAMGYHPANRRLLFFGGWRGYPQAPAGFRMFCDTWAFDGRRWAQLADGPCMTTRVRNNSLVYDVRRRAMLLVDGTPEVPGDSARPARLWRWSETGWTLVDSLGPRRATWQRAVYDASRSVLVFPVLEGPDAGVWEWDGSRWRHIVADGPSSRQVAALQYDPRRQRVVLVGGQTLTRPSTFLRDAWTWDGTRWSELALAGAPSERSGGHLVDDPVNNRLLYFGGYRGPPMRMLQELWSLDAAGWRQLRP
jgi:hypothetical protein